MRTNVMVRDMDLQPHDRLDTRRLEVVADGPSMRGGAQLATDTTLVSRLAGDGSAERLSKKPGGGNERTYPELAGKGGRAKFVVLPAEVGGWWSKETRLASQV